MSEGNAALRATLEPTMRAIFLSLLMTLSTPAVAGFSYTWDGEADSDSDGLTNNEEVAIGTSPFDPDTDGDGYRDGYDHDPLSATLTSLQEYCEWKVLDGVTDSDVEECGIWIDIGENDVWHAEQKAKFKGSTFDDSDNDPLGIYDEEPTGGAELDGACTLAEVFARDSTYCPD